MASLVRRAGHYLGGSETITFIAATAGPEFNFSQPSGRKVETSLYGFSGEVVGVPDNNTLYGEECDRCDQRASMRSPKRSLGMPLSAIVLTATDGAANVFRDLSATLKIARAATCCPSTIMVLSDY